MRIYCKIRVLGKSVFFWASGDVGNAFFISSYFLGGIGVYFPTCYYKLDPGRFVELFVYYSSACLLKS